MRTELAPSLSSFRSEIARWVEVSSTVRSKDAEELAREIGAHLDDRFNQLVDAARASTVLRVVRERTPVTAGALYAFAFGAATAGGGFQPATTLTGLGGLTLSQTLIALLTTIQRRGALQRHPMYWRLKMSPQAPDARRSRTRSNRT